MLRSTYRAAAGAFTALLVAVQYWLMAGDEVGGELLAASIRFFSFFTILTNLLAAAALLVPLIAPRSAIGAFLDRPGVRTAITGYIIIVGVVYFLLLRGLSHRQGWPLHIEEMLHYVTPPLFVIDWLAFVDKRELDWRIGPRALAYPLAYIAWTLVHGAATGWYPYPFVDVDDLGYPQVLGNIVGLIAIFLVLEVALAAIGRRIGLGSDSSA